MIENDNKSESPLRVWDSWPYGELKKGDILKVSWWYDGVHGPVTSEDFYILLGCKNEEKEEKWDCIIFSSCINGEKRHAPFRHQVICGDDFGNSDSSEWQQISLIARSEA